MKKPKIALAHEFLTQYGGAEKTFEAIAELFPDAPIYTAKLDKSVLPENMKNRNYIAPKSSLVNKAIKYFFVFMMAPVFESFDFSKYDIVISDGNTWNKGILTKPDQMHITYVHTPPRFLYGYSTESTKRGKWYFKLFFSYLDNLLRLWDYTAAQRPEYILANSQEVQKRILKFYRRKSTVIYPPVDLNYEIIENFKPPFDKPYYVAVGRIVKYKNFDKLVEAFNLLELPLVVVGSGNYVGKLKQLAKNNVKFMGHTSDNEKYTLIKNSLGLINPVDDEDFGIVPLEAMSQGKPVLGHKSGGHLETIVEGKTGMFFSELTVEDIVRGMKEFDKAIRDGKFDETIISESVEKYSKDRFKDEFKGFVTEAWVNFMEQ